MLSFKRFAWFGVAALGLAAGAAHARDNVYWSIGVQAAPGVVVNAGNARPYYAPPPVYVQPAPVYVPPPPVYHAPNSYYAPPVVYYPPRPVYYSPAPVYVRPGPPPWHRHHHRHDGWRR